MYIEPYSKNIDHYSIMIFRTKRCFVFLKSRKKITWHTVYVHTVLICPTNGAVALS
jgi:hypothetical protein